MLSSVDNDADTRMSRSVSTDSINDSDPVINYKPRTKTKTVKKEPRKVKKKASPTRPCIPSSSRALHISSHPCGVQTNHSKFPSSTDSITFPLPKGLQNLPKIGYDSISPTSSYSTSSSSEDEPVSPKWKKTQDERSKTVPVPMSVIKKVEHVVKEAEGCGGSNVVTPRRAVILQER